MFSLGIKGLVLCQPSDQTSSACKISVSDQHQESQATKKHCTNQMSSIGYSFHLELNLITRYQIQKKINCDF